MAVRPEYDFRVIGRNLKKYRLAKHLSVEDVREYMQLGTSQAIYKWERGDGLPQADSLLALLELYGINRIDMITEESAILSSDFFWRQLFNFTLNDRAEYACYTINQKQENG